MYYNGNRQLQTFSNIYYKTIEEIFKSFKILIRCGLESQGSDITDTFEQAPLRGAVSNIRRYKSIFTNDSAVSEADGSLPVRDRREGEPWICNVLQYSPILILRGFKNSHKKLKIKMY